MGSCIDYIVKSGLCRKEKEPKLLTTNPTKLSMSSKETRFSKSFIVWLILNQRAEEAINLLAQQYRVTVPRLKVGLPKGHKKNIYGCYQSKNETISVYSSDVLSNPFVILHEFYHHIRTSIDKQHRGTEKNADRFATEFLEEYRAASGHEIR